jgi:hypothetical protein
MFEPESLRTRARLPQRITMTVIETAIQNLNARRLEKVAALHWYESLEQTCADWGFLSVSDGLKSMAWDELRHSEMLTVMVATLEGRHGDAQPVQVSPVQIMTRNPNEEVVIFALEVADSPPVNWMFWNEPDVATKSKFRIARAAHSGKIGSRWSKQTNRKRSKLESKRGGKNMNDIAKDIHEDMLVHASDNGSNALIGKVVGIKKHKYIKLGKRASANGERRYIPLEWVASVTAEVVYLNKNARTVRIEWLDKAALKRQLQTPHVLNEPARKRGQLNAASD